MKKTALIFWPEGGNVEKVTDVIMKNFDFGEIQKVSVSEVTKELLNECDNWIVGGSTVGSHVWEDADDSNKWHNFFKMLEDIDFSTKTLAMFGLGDQILYPHHFVDELGILNEEFEKRNAKIVGHWPTSGYKFSDSEGVVNNMFYGLALDEDNQENETEERVQQWLAILKKEFGI